MRTKEAHINMEAVLQFHKAGMFFINQVQHGKKFLEQGKSGLSIEILSKGFNN